MTRRAPNPYPRAVIDADFESMDGRPFPFWSATALGISGWLLIATVLVLVLR